MNGDDMLFLFWMLIGKLVFVYVGMDKLVTFIYLMFTTISCRRRRCLCLYSNYVYSSTEKKEFRTELENEIFLSVNDDKYDFF